MIHIDLDRCAFQFCTDNLTYITCMGFISPFIPKICCNLVLIIFFTLDHFNSALSLLTYSSAFS